MKSQRMVQWFGSNTENAAEVGRLLNGCRFVGIPFAGGMSEVPFITAKQILANDLHRHVINLCRVVANDEARAWLVKTADEQPYHPTVLENAQREAVGWLEEFASDDWWRGSGFLKTAALAYFTAVWMGRGGNAGTKGEFSGALPIRWNANGGGSNRRYRTAIEALDAWGEAFRRCEFICMDGLDFIRRFQDVDGNGLYVDANWPDAGDEYQDVLTAGQHRTLAEVLRRFSKARVVVRFGDHELIRELYQEGVGGWTWLANESRDQTNAVKPEWLIVRNCS